MKTHTVLGMHAFAHGFGWIVLEQPSSPLDWGVVERKHNRNRACLTALDRILLRYQPAVLAMEAYGHAPTVRISRIRRFCRSVCARSEKSGARVHIHARAEVQAVFASVDAKYRHEVALAVARQIPAIAARLPKKRAIWESERPNMALFNAAAAALTHYAANGMLELTPTE